MKYGIWRHENALGNSAEQAVNLSNFIQKNKDDKPVILVEKEFQKDFALCIPGVKESNVHFYESTLDLENLSKHGHMLKDVCMPDVYFNNNPHHYPSVWKDLSNLEFNLEFPEDTYENKHNLPKGAIVMAIRENGTYWKRVDGASSDPGRSVNPQTFFDVALHFAEKGHTVIRVGDKNQTPMPEHENIIDFSKFEDTRMLDDMFLIKYAKVFLACDSGIWPMAGGFGSPLILSNVTSVFSSNPPKYEITSWLSEKNSVVLYKKNRQDNSFDELVESVNKFL